MTEINFPNQFPVQKKLSCSRKSFRDSWKFSYRNKKQVTRKNIINYFLCADGMIRWNVASFCLVKRVFMKIFLCVKVNKSFIFYQVTGRIRVRLAVSITIAVSLRELNCKEGHFHGSRHPIRHKDDKSYVLQFYPHPSKAERSNALIIIWRQK